MKIFSQGAELKIYIKDSSEHSFGALVCRNWNIIGQLVKHPIKSKYFVYLNLQSVKNKNRKEYFVSFYRSTSQIQDEFDSLLLKFEQLIYNIVTRNQFSVLITSDANVRTINR